MIAASTGGRSKTPAPRRIACISAACAGALLAAWLFPGCGTISYYTQAVGGHFEIVRLQRSGAELRADPETPEALVRKLALIEELREFAGRELGLPAGDNYTQYADLGRQHVVWSVFAAPEFSLEPVRWWYPAVGRLSYRGFFREEAAREFGARLEERGLDVYVGGVDAYSTLGWFDDPVLNTFASGSDVEVAELIFHELTHRRLYLPHETELNEALATAVAQDGVRHWLRSRGDSGALAEYEKRLRRRRELYRLIDEARRRLAVVYAADDESRSSVELRRRKEGILSGLNNEYRQLKRGWGSSGAGRAPLHKWFSRELTNAHLNAVATYHRRVPEFERLLAEYEGNRDGFFRAVKNKRRKPADGG